MEFTKIEPTGGLEPFRFQLFNMTTQEALTLFDYDRWAAGSQLQVISRLSEEEYARDLGSSHGGLRGTLVHIYAAQLIWYTRWKGDSPSALVAAVEIPTLEMLQHRWQGLRDQLHEFAVTLTDEKLREPLTYKDTKGIPHAEPLCNQIGHAINHSTYHRGQITMMLRQLGAAPPASIDLITYYRMVDETGVK